MGFCGRRNCYSLHTAGRAIDIWHQPPEARRVFGGRLPFNPLLVGTHTYHLAVARQVEVKLSTDSPELSCDPVSVLDLGGTATTLFNRLAKFKSPDATNMFRWYATPHGDLWKLRIELTSEPWYVELCLVHGRDQAVQFARTYSAKAIHKGTSPSTISKKSQDKKLLPKALHKDNGYVCRAPITAVRPTYAGSMPTREFKVPCGQSWNVSSQFDHCQDWLLSYRTEAELLLWSPLHHDSTAFACTTEPWEEAVKICCQLAAPGKVKKYVTALSINGGAWESAIAGDRRRKQCHAHLHIILAARFVRQNRLRLLPKQPRGYLDKKTNKFHRASRQWWGEPSPTYLAEKAEDAKRLKQNLVLTVSI